MANWQEDVTAFHTRFGHPVGGNGPALLPPSRMAFRRKIMEEEFIETLTGLYTGDLVEIADGIIDTIYVLIGTAVECGIDLAPLWDAVHAANMAKTPNGTGKPGKPEGWKEPNIAGLLLGQGAQKLNGP